MKWHRHSLFAVRTQRSAIVLPCRAFEVRCRRADRGGPDGVDSQVREVKTGVLLVPSERVETSPGRHSLVRRFLVSCLGDANAIFARLYGQLRELG
jgi:hypothetical protein